MTSPSEPRLRWVALRAERPMRDAAASIAESMKEHRPGAML